MGKVLKRFGFNFGNGTIFSGGDMKKIVLCLLVLMVFGFMGFGQEKGDRLAVLWTSSDPDVAKKIAFVYTMNAQKNEWFDTIRFVIWGPSTKLLSEDKELQESVVKMKKLGVELYACKWCSDSYGASELLEKLGVNVIYYGKPLTKLIKEGWPILTF